MKIARNDYEALMIAQERGADIGFREKDGQRTATVFLREGPPKTAESLCEAVNRALMSEKLINLRRLVNETLSGAIDRGSELDFAIIELRSLLADIEADETKLEHQSDAGLRQAFKEVAILGQQDSHS